MWSPAGWGVIYSSLGKVGATPVQEAQREIQQHRDSPGQPLGIFPAWNGREASSGALGSVSLSPGENSHCV